jgi:hypothetical protein
MTIGITSSAQLYSTQAGKILVSGQYKGTNVAGVSNHLHMHVNYDRLEMLMRLVIPTMITDNDSLNVLLQKLTGSEMQFNGRMNVSNIPTKPHSKQKFATNGVLTINGVSKPFSFMSSLEHLPRGNVSCLFNASFTVNLNEFGIATAPGEYIVSVRFNQMILKRPGE